MINIRQDLIQKELERGCTNRLTFRKLKPSNRFIDKLFNHYYVVEHTEHFYDSEPEYDDECGRYNYSWYEDADAFGPELERKYNLLRDNRELFIEGDVNCGGDYDG